MLPKYSINKADETRIYIFLKNIFYSTYKNTLHTLFCFNYNFLQKQILQNLRFENSIYFWHIRQVMGSERNMGLEESSDLLGGDIDSSEVVQKTTEFKLE